MSSSSSLPPSVDGARTLRFWMTAAQLRFPGDDMNQLPKEGSTPCTCFYMQSRFVSDPHASRKETNIKLMARHRDRIACCRVCRNSNTSSGCGQWNLMCDCPQAVGQAVTCQA